MLNAAPAAPVAEAVTEYVPATLLAVIVAEVATPSAPVTPAFDPPAYRSDAPDPGTTNDTDMPGTKFPYESVTLALNVLVNAVSIVAV
jgi:hypothetical protein